MSDDVRTPDDRLFIASLQKGLQVLDLIENYDEDVGVQKVADIAGLTKSNAQRILHTLWQLHYIDQDPDTRKYRPSLKVYLNGYARFQNTEMFRLAQEQLLNLSYETGETCVLVMLDGWDAVVVLAVTGRFPSSVNLRVGMRFDAGQVTSGRLLLAFHTVDGRVRLATSTGEKAEAEARMRRLTELGREFSEIGRQGYLATIGAIFEGNASLSAPIIDGAGRPRAALNISMTKARYGELGEQHLASLVKSAAMRVSSELGFRPTTTSNPDSENHGNR